jgi:hypothetical protein
MNNLTYTLITDGSSDKCLIEIITWMLERHFPDREIQSQWADLRRIQNKQLVNSLSRKIKTSIEYYPCDLLFVHRDAEKETVEKREQEIHAAVSEVESSEKIPKVICVIPIRMLEAWLTFDEQAIRRASDNPNGKIALTMPSLKSLEQEPNPKEKLHNLLKDASGLSGRRKQKFNVDERVHRVAELIDDFSPLLQLSAFKLLETKITEL